jgi:hypothetical protein
MTSSHADLGTASGEGIAPLLSIPSLFFTFYSPLLFPFWSPLSFSFPFSSVVHTSSFSFLVLLFTLPLCRSPLVLPLSYSPFLRPLSPPLGTHNRGSRSLRSFLALRRPRWSARTRLPRCASWTSFCSWTTGRWTRPRGCACAETACARISSPRAPSTSSTPRGCPGRV